jgi:hypothetical protein
MLFLNLHFHGIVVAEIFSGLWLFPLALLVYRSRFLPRFLGVWLALARLRLGDPERPCYCRNITRRCLPTLSPPSSCRGTACCARSSLCGCCGSSSRALVPFQLFRPNNGPTIGRKQRLF